MLFTIYKTLQIPVIILTIVFLAGCGPKIETNKLSEVDLDKYNTYAWLPDGDSITNPKYQNLGLNEAIINEVNQNMQEEGYTLDRDNPDLLILTHTMFNTDTDIVKDPVYTTYTYYEPGFYTGRYYSPYYYTDYASVTRLSGYDIDQVQYTEGRVVIDLIDREKNQVVWRGIADDYIEPINVQDEVRNYVEAIFDEFPS